MKPPGSRPKARRAYRPSGVYSMKARGHASIDGRSALGRQLKAWQTDIASDLGGDLSRAQETLVALATRDLAVVLVADRQLSALGDAIVTGRGRDRGFIQLVRDRQSAAAALEGRLRLLGLRRVKAPPLTLAQYLETRASKSVATATAQDARGGSETATNPAQVRRVDGRGGSAADGPHGDAA